MATYCAVHIKTNDVDAVGAYLLGWLRSQHRTDEIVERELPRFPELYGDSFIADELPPSMFAIGNTPLGWVSAHFNSFLECGDLSIELSRHCATTVVGVLAQSVSDAYYLEVAKKGRHLRTLYYAGDQGEWVKQNGAPLEFESTPLGTNVAEGDDPAFYVFGRSDVADYCRNLGLELWGSHEPNRWVSLSVVTRSGTSEPVRSRPWWMFWK